MVNKYVDINPDGDTLIILPFIKAANKAGDIAHNRHSLSNNDDSLEVEPSLFVSDDQEEGEDNIKSQEVYYFKVSMKHLLLAFSRAKALLQGPFRESIPTADGLRHWKFDPIFDPEAFKIIISIIHAKSNNVPEQVSLEMLSEIAVIVNDLNCQDSVTIFTRFWLKALDSIITPLNRTTAFSDDGIYFARLIFIFSVFKLGMKFTIATHNAVLYSPSISSSFGLPIPPQILAKNVYLCCRKQKSFNAL
ncbi:hypothetical protein GGI43DRAFT_384878 [Trichoderma evansii]